MTPQNQNDENDDIYRKIEPYIDHKISEAKFLASEKRVNYILWGAGLIITVLVALFGIIIPMVQTNRLSDKIDASLHNMQEQQKYIEESNIKRLSEFDTKFNYEKSNLDKHFQELAGTQLKKANVECFYRSSRLDNININLTQKNNSESIIIKNIGNDVARNIRVKLYADASNVGLTMHPVNEGYYSENQPIVIISDEPSFKYAYEYTPWFSNIDPGEERLFYISFYYGEQDTLGSKIYPIMISLLYGVPEIKKYKFTLICKTK
ncbi:MAG: hypothetical protein ACYDEQ_01170 [Desulfocucumaceae bacterium]